MNVRSAAIYWLLILLAMKVGLVTRAAVRSQQVAAERAIRQEFVDAGGEMFLPPDQGEYDVELPDPDQPPSPDDLRFLTHWISISEDDEILRAARLDPLGPNDRLQVDDIPNRSIRRLDEGPDSITYSITAEFAITRIATDSVRVSRTAGIEWSVRVPATDGVADGVGTQMPGSPRFFDVPDSRALS